MKTKLVTGLALLSIGGEHHVYISNLSSEKKTYHILRQLRQVETKIIFLQALPA